MITYSQFISQFPEFKTQEQATIEQAIAGVLIETNCYEGLGTPLLQQYALMLHTAHNLTLSQWNNEGNSRLLKTVRSNNDSMEFANVGYSLESTTYGVRLQTVLRRANTIFAIC